jgi:hypothetical protein
MEKEPPRFKDRNTLRDCGMARSAPAESLFHAFAF